MRMMRKIRKRSRRMIPARSGRNLRLCCHTLSTLQLDNPGTSNKSHKEAQVVTTSARASVSALARLG